jgi:hypothetical protein
MRPRVCLEAGQVEARCFVHEAAIFGAQRKVSREAVVGAASVKESAPRLRSCACKGATGIISRIKNQAATSCERLRLDPREARQFHHC